MWNERLILLIDDDDNDVFFFAHAVARAGRGLQYRRAHNGQEAIDYLLGDGSFSDRKKYPVPDLILVDLKMPICDGFQFLTWKDKEQTLAPIPTIVLTSSDEESDVRRSYELGANSFTTKIADPHIFSDRVQAMGEWWFNQCPRVPVE